MLMLDGSSLAGVVLAPLPLWPRKPTPLDQLQPLETRMSFFSDDDVVVYRGPQRVEAMSVNGRPLVPGLENQSQATCDVLDWLKRVDYRSLVRTMEWPRSGDPNAPSNPPTHEL
jgi:hypothetical protein